MTDNAIDVRLSVSFTVEALIRPKDLETWYPNTSKDEAIRRYVTEGIISQKDGGYPARWFEDLVVDNALSNLEVTEIVEEPK